MTIPKRIEEALEAMDRGDPEAALIPVSIAVAATADREQSETSDNQRYKAFLHDNLELITRCGLGGVGISESWNIRYQHPELRPNAQGHVTIEQILYHVVRCGLMHNARLPDTLHFTMEPIVKLDDGHLTLPGSLVFGLVAAVVGAPSNVNCEISETFALRTPKAKFSLNSLWGSKEELLKICRGETAA